MPGATGDHPPAGLELSRLTPRTVGFQRDNSCWIYGGVSVNPMAKPARKRETLHSRATYRYHPLFAGAGFVTYCRHDRRQ